MVEKIKKDGYFPNCGLGGITGSHALQPIAISSAFIGNFRNSYF